MFKTPQVCFGRMQLISWQNVIAVFTKVHKGHNFSSHAFSVGDLQAVKSSCWLHENSYMFIKTNKL